MNDLTKGHCVPCEGGTEPLKESEIQEYLSSLHESWEVVENKAIRRSVVCKNFKAALEFINKIGELAEQEGHHPNLHLTNYKNLTIELSTHAIEGLSTNDFIMAAKIDQIIET